METKGQQQQKQKQLILAPLSEVSYMDQMMSECSVIYHIYNRTKGQGLKVADLYEHVP